PGTSPALLLAPICKGRIHTNSAYILLSWPVPGMFLLDSPEPAAGPGAVFSVWTTTPQKIFFGGGGGPFKSLLGGPPPPGKKILGQRGPGRGWPRERMQGA